jgi:hypothetical protein
MIIREWFQIERKRIPIESPKRRNWKCSDQTINNSVVGKPSNVVCALTNLIFRNML